jgi:hypothetical protein
MNKKASLIVTITDGWAFRFLFCTGALEYLNSIYKIKIFASGYYFSKLSAYPGVEFELYSIDINKSRIIDKVISLKNYIYRNFHGFNISKFYISKLNRIQRILFFIINPFIVLYGDRVIFLLDSLVSLLLRKHLRKFQNDVIGCEGILFLSPYSSSEIKFLNVFENQSVKKYFILPSWDNIYKYHLNDIYYRYIVWGPDQKEFLKKIGISENKIVCLGSISQYVFNRIKTLDLNKKSFLNSEQKFRLMYSTVTSKIFPEEFQFVTQLVDLVNTGYFGPSVDLLIRLHPADSSSEYKYLQSDRVTISGNYIGSDIIKWEVSDDFFELQVKDILSSNLIISVASTMTLDSILLGRTTVNYRPMFCINEKDYYNFEHYNSITSSNGIKIINNFEELNKIISDYRKGEYVIDEKMYNSILGATVRHNEYELKNYFKFLFNEN